MKAIAINGSPRKNWNTHILLEKCLEGIEATATYQFDDYSKYAMTYFDGKKRLKRRETVFAKDCKKSFELGKNLTKNEF